LGCFFALFLLFVTKSKTQKAGGGYWGTVPPAVFCLVLAFVFCCAASSVCLSLRWHPRYAFVLQTSPLCGAAPTFLCRRKEK
jgi:hypothetical protein